MPRSKPPIHSGAGYRALLLSRGLVCVMSLAVFEASAQSRTTCRLGVRVADGGSEAPLAGVAARIESTALIGGPRTGATDGKGRFQFPEIPPGVYVLTVSLKGFKTVRIEKIELSAGLSTELPIKMTLFAGEETVHVIADPIAIDAGSSATTTVLPPEYMKNIPTDRDPSHILSLAPGINLESAYGGAEESGNAYQVDGVDISDPEGGAPWALFNYNLIDEVDLVGLGAPAEYGEFTGVVFNSVTKSGGNDFSGEAELIYTNKSLTGRNSDDPDFASTIDSHTEQIVQVGGPIHRDKLWYFVSAQYARDLASEGGPTETEIDPRFFGKLTWQASPSNTIQGWLEWAHTKITGSNGDAETPLEATTTEDNPEVVWNLSWKSVLSEASILNVAWAGYSGHHDSNPASGFSTPGHLDVKTEEASGNAQLFGLLNRLRHQVNVSLIHHASDFMKGEHDSKIGAEIERSSLHNRAGFPGGAFFQDNAGPEIDPSTGMSDPYTLAQFGGDFEARARNERVSLYAQDSWRIGTRLTLNPGLRMDLNRGKVSSGTVFRTNPLAPRIGFAWDLKGDARSVLKAHYGRYYEALYTDFYQDLDPGAFLPLTTQKIFNTSGFVQNVSTIPGQKFAMDPHIRHPRLDQYILGFDREVGHGIVLSGTLVYRRNRDLIETVSRDGQFVPVKGEIPGTGRKATLFDYLNPSTDLLLYTNPPELHRTYRAAILSATRRLRGNWQLQASYVYSRARGNTDNLGPMGIESPGLGANTPDFYGRFLDTPNSLVNAEGRLTHDQTHQVKLQGTRLFPSLHLSVSADYTFHSGDTWTPRTDCLLTDDGNGVIGDGILGCHSFPQGTVLYLAEPRGSRRLPSRSELDLRVEWTHALAGDRSLRLYGDILNLNNQGRATEVETFLGPEAGKPATLNFPRNLRLGVEYAW